MKHKGHNYKIVYCDPNQDWGKFKGKFRIDMAIREMSNRGYFDTFAEAEVFAKSSIDEFTKSVPQAKQEWLDAIRSCMVWSDYESCDTDDDMVWDLLVKAKTHLRIEDENQQ